MKKAWIFRLLSIPVTVLTIVLVYVLKIPNPMMILIIPVVFFAYVDGYIGGALSGLTAIAYSVYFFFVHTADKAAAEKAMTIVLAVGAIVLLVGKLNRKNRLQVLESRRHVQNFLRILSGMDVQLLVTDPKTDYVLFANEKMNKGYDIDYDPTGLPCWQVYHGRKARCEFCPMERLYESPDVPIEWEYFNERTGRRFHNRESMIPWTDGQVVHLQQAVDVTEIHNKEDILQKRLEQQELMSNIAQSFISEGDTASLIQEALKSTGEFLGLDRVVLARVDEAGQTCQYYTGWYRDPKYKIDAGAIVGVSLAMLMDKLAAQTGPYLILSDVAADPDLAFLKDQGVRGAVIAPVYMEGALWGLFSLERCDVARDFAESDLFLTSLVSNLIGGVLLRERSREAMRMAKERAEESALAKASFLANMSHEIRTPMNAIIGMTELARASRDPERVQYCLGKVDDAANHLLGVINDILDMSKIDAGKMELSSTDFPLEKMLQRVSNVTQFRAEQKKQELIIKVDKDVPPSIVSDQQRLTQVLTNLLSNAVKFTPEGGKVSVLVRNIDQSDGMCTLEFNVVDTGIGISKEAQKRLFASFQQADSTVSRRFGGTGLGLAISKNIVELMGGKIGIDSEENKGARFYFTIRVPIGTSKAPTRLSNEIDWNKVHILVVDDEQDVRDYFTDVLAISGIRCMTAADGFEALDQLKKDKLIKAAFVDLRMPGMDGLELTEKMRQAYRDDLTVVLISSTEWKEIEAEAQRAGVDDYIAKPLLPSTIIDSLNKHLAGQSALAQSPRNLAPTGALKGACVLMAEDIEINREILIAMLEDTGVQFDCAENGQQAVDMFKLNPQKYDAILMDIHMPEMDGYEATRAIRAEGNAWAQRVPIIAMTANVFKEDIDRCLNAGMDDHIGKPINLEEVLSKLAHYTRGS